MALPRRSRERPARSGNIARLGAEGARVQRHGTKWTDRQGRDSVVRAVMPQKEDRPSRAKQAGNNGGRAGEGMTNRFFAREPGGWWCRLPGFLPGAMDHARKCGSLSGRGAAENRTTPAARATLREDRHRHRPKPHRGFGERPLGCE